MYNLSIIIYLKSITHDRTILSAKGYHVRNVTKADDAEGEEDNESSCMHGRARKKTEGNR